jgi:hypothetical protein
LHCRRSGDTAWSLSLVHRCVDCSAVPVLYVLHSHHFCVVTCVGTITTLLCVCVGTTIFVCSQLLFPQKVLWLWGSPRTLTLFTQPLLLTLVHTTTCVRSSCSPMTATTFSVAPARTSHLCWHNHHLLISTLTLCLHHHLGLFAAPVHP